MSVDVICSGKRQHYESREAAIEFYLDAMACSEGAEKERYTNIYLELRNTSKKLVSDGEPEIKEIPEKTEYNNIDKSVVIKKIKSGELSVNSKVIYDVMNGGLQFKDRDILKTLLEMEGWYAAQFLRPYIHDDKELIIVACKGGKNSNNVLCYASEDLKNNKEFALELIRLNCLNFASVSDALSNDAELVYAALSNANTDVECEIIKKKIGTDLLIEMSKDFAERKKVFDIRKNGLDAIIDDIKTFEQIKQEINEKNKDANRGR